VTDPHPPDQGSPVPPNQGSPVPPNQGSPVPPSQGSQPPAGGAFPPPHGGGPPSPQTTDPDADDARQALHRVRSAIGEVVVGQDGIVTGLLAALLVRGHVLLEGVPGVAKTLIVTSLARSLEVRHARVQFTPDLMPSDVTGQTILDPDGRGLSFREGPVFTNLLVADEINRTPPRTQAALLEAMQERQVSVDGQARALPHPFLVVATQNPIDHEGTYPLPDAQLDRFLFKLVVQYPDREQEQRILDRDLAGGDAGPNPDRIKPVATPDDLEVARRAVAAVRVEPAVRDYVVDLARATRGTPAVELGVSPRGAAMLLHAARAWAWLSGRSYVGPDEVKAVAKPVLRHRLRLRPEVELEGATSDAVLDNLLATVPVPR
jgi:MoxR-like ATPase